MSTQIVKGLKLFFAEARRGMAVAAACLAFGCSAIAFEGSASERLAEAQQELFADRVSICHDAGRTGYGR